MNPAPHNIDAERAVLGAMLLHPAYIPVVQVDCRLTPADFYWPQYGAVYESILRLNDEQRATDELTISVDLQEHGQDAPTDLDELTSHAPAAGNVREYARIVRDLALRRRVLKVAQQTEEEARSPTGDVRDLLDRAEMRMLSIEDETVGQLQRLPGDDERERLDRVLAGEEEQPGVASGLTDVDEFTGGWQRDRLYVVAARPGMGKSAFAVTVAASAAKEGLAVAVFSLEMSRHEILRRLVSTIARVPAKHLVKSPMMPKHHEKAVKAIDDILKWPLFVDESPDLSVTEARVKAKRLHARHPLGLVVVDYLQLMRAEGGENRNVEVGRISRGLKVLAKELHVPVIGVSQLSRSVEGRGAKVPMLSDLRDSGSIEQDADAVLFLYRRSYYKPDEPDDGEADLIVAKHRNGPTGRVKLTFIAEYPRFANYIDPVTYGFDAPPPPSSSEEMPF